MKNILKLAAAVFSLFMCLPTKALAHELVYISDDPVPQTVASHCTVHWSLLLVVGIYALYAVVRAIANKRAMQNETEDSEGR